MKSRFIIKKALNRIGFAGAIASLILLGLATLFALFHGVENFRGVRAWKRHVHWLETIKREPWKMETIIPPPISDEDNMAMAPIWKPYFEFERDSKTGNLVWKQGYPANQGRPLAAYHWRSSEAERIIANENLAGWTRGRPLQLEYWQRYYRYLSGESIPVEIVEDQWLQPGMERAFEKIYGISREAFIEKTSEDKKTILALPSKNRNKATENPFPVQEQAGDPAEDILTALNGFKENYEAIKEAAQRPKSRFPIRYENHWGALLPHLSAIKSCCQYLSLKSVAELKSGRSDEALEDILLGLRLTDSIADEPFQICQLVRFSLFPLLLQPVWEGLQGDAWNPDQSARLQSALDKDDLIPQVRMGLQSKRAAVLGAALESLKSWPNKEFMEHLPMINFPYMDRPWFSFLTNHPGWIPKGWLFQNMVTISKSIQVELDLMSDTGDKWLRPIQWEAIRDDSHQGSAPPINPYNWLKIMVMSGPYTHWEDTVKKAAIAQAYLEMARAALALNTYRQVHGRHPNSLDEAEFSKFLLHPAIDPLFGNALIYKPHPESQSFTLYSLGWDGDDDGGVTSKESAGYPFQNRDEGDWVWPMVGSDIQAD